MSRHKMPGSQKWDTWVEVDGVELDVAVFFDSSPAEPDVNWGGDLDITAVYFQDEGCMLEAMSEDETEALYTRVEEQFFGEEEEQ
jgi:hypothetical protein